MQLVTFLSAVVLSIAAFFPSAGAQTPAPTSAPTNKVPSKVAGWELCAAPWYSETGLLNTTIGVSGFNPDQYSAVVRGLYPCPYTETSTMYGLWTQDCNYNLYAYRYEGKFQITTCYNTLVLYGEGYQIKQNKPGYMPTTLTWESLANVDYGTGKAATAVEADEKGRLLAYDEDDQEEKKPRSWRWATEDKASEWKAPKSIEYTSVHIINGAGKFLKPLNYISTIKINQEFKLESKGWEVKTAIGIFYKKMYYNYKKL